MTKETLAKKIFDECAKDGEPVTMEEALEMADMEIKSGSIKNYTQSSAEKKSKKEVKLDQTKVDFIQALAEMLEDVETENVTIINPQKEIGFTIKGESYSLSLIKHRPKKK